MSLETDPDGVPVVYDHPDWSKRSGLRRRLDRPFGIAGGDTPAEGLAAEIGEISEPLGRSTTCWSRTMVCGGATGSPTP